MTVEKSCARCKYSVCVNCHGPYAEGSVFQPYVGVIPAIFTAPGALRTAAETLEARGKQYDQDGGERSMGKTVAAFNVITGRDLRESEGWLLLQLLKDVRDCTTDNPHEDSLIDCVAYSALKAEARMAGK